MVKFLWLWSRFYGFGQDLKILVPVIFGFDVRKRQTDEILPAIHHRRTMHAMDINYSYRPSGSRCRPRCQHHSCDQLQLQLHCRHLQLRRRRGAAAAMETASVHLPLPSPPSPSPSQLLSRRTISHRCHVLHPPYSTLVQRRKIAPKFSHHSLSNIMLVIYSVVAVAITFLASSATELPMKMTAYAFAVHRCYKRPLPSTMERYLNNNKDNARQRRRNNEYSSESRLLPRLPMATQSNHNNATQTSNSKFNVDQDVEHSNDDSLIDDEEENTDEEMIDMLLSPPQIDNFDMDDEDIQLLSPTEVQSMTIPQLKQQLRLRGKKVWGLNHN